MKKNLLLIASLLFGAGSFAQFTESNAPSIGDGQTLFVIDSMAPNYDSTIGEGVTWDYSAYGGYNGDTRLLSVYDATGTPNAGDFPNSTLALDLEGMLMSYMTNDAGGRISQGFIFSEPTLGEVISTFEDDPEQLYTYPFDFGSAITDDIAGNFSVDSPLGPIESTLTGTSEASVDGKGTLVLADQSYTDVLRYKISESMDVTVPLMGALQITRTQYEYYDHSESNLPIFIHATLLVLQPGSEEPMMESFVVLSLEEPSFGATSSISTNALAATNIYPNPAVNELNIQLPSDINQADVVITDALGRKVTSFVVNNSISTIDVAHLNQGTYFVNITSANNNIVRTVVIN